MAVIVGTAGTAGGTTAGCMPTAPATTGTTAATTPTTTAPPETVPTQPVPTTTVPTTTLPPETTPTTPPATTATTAAARNAWPATTIPACTTATTAPTVTAPPPPAPPEPTATKHPHKPQKPEPQPAPLVEAAPGPAGLVASGADLKPYLPPKPADAVWPTPPGVRSDHARAAYLIASGHWSSSRCKGGEQVALASQADLMRRAGDAAPSNPNLLLVAFADDDGCRVWLNEQATWSPARLCLIAEHEFGHLAGRSHTYDDPDDVMAPIVRRAPDCEAMFGRAETVEGEAFVEAHADDSDDEGVVRTRKKKRACKAARARTRPAKAAAKAKAKAKAKKCAPKRATRRGTRRAG